MLPRRTPYNEIDNHNMLVNKTTPAGGGGRNVEAVLRAFLSSVPHETNKYSYKQDELLISNITGIENGG